MRMRKFLLPSHVGGGALHVPSAWQVAFRAPICRSWGEQRNVATEPSREPHESDSTVLCKTSGHDVTGKT